MAAKKIVCFLVLLNSLCFKSLAIGDSIPQVQYEITAEVQERNFDKGKLQKTKESAVFQYDLNTKKEEISLLDKILYKIVLFIAKALSNSKGSGSGMLFYMICLLALAAVIIIAMWMTTTGIFARKNIQEKSNLDFSEFTEDIHSIDFDKMIEETIKFNKFGRAVRLYYLKSLKQLSDKNHIQWEIDKTNRDYLHELQNPSIKNGFENITYLYEHVWYGNTEIDKAKFSKMEETFHKFLTLSATAK
ncbi:MAG TPA: DUF4129 domain-containing protein [Cytophagaceae bacterium]|jgi:hypothetical protein|nr:DUF4129 domain-containing protein [Cytophagaceae bacterium]